MSTEQTHQQMEKWRRQERFNKFLIRSTLAFLICAALVAVTIFLINILRATPTFSPSELNRQWKDREGQTVRVQGEVDWIDGIQVRVRGEGSETVLCTFSYNPKDLKVGDLIKVQGTVSASSGLTNCKIIHN
jgi:hypothetical protein